MQRVMVLPHADLYGALVNQQLNHANPTSAYLDTPDSRSPHLDWHYLEALADGCAEFMAELLQIFIADSQNHLSTLRVAIAQGDYSTALHAIHQIKGASANVGALTLQAIAARLEQHLRHNQIPQAHLLVHELNRALHIVQTLSYRH